MHGETVETLDLSVSDVAVGDHRRGDDAACGLFTGQLRMSSPP